ncbi:PREDICTED: uncharacterized protein LOC105145588 [Acromyrmex echinatior]|uniref:uncharacterized protein LOC105145588 n=1 Tax=Acromyrmex echinatior TaxID=103372 RepID=UPI000580E3F4|nr:PREDICTED: uncharacterized protein LOC105145588 [Acromyrmex echinatior]
MIYVQRALVRSLFNDRGREIGATFMEKFLLRKIKSRYNDETVINVEKQLALKIVTIFRAISLCTFSKNIVRSAVYIGALLTNIRHRQDLLLPVLAEEFHFYMYVCARTHVENGQFIKKILMIILVYRSSTEKRILKMSNLLKNIHTHTRVYSLLYTSACECKKRAKNDPYEKQKR